MEISVTINGVSQMVAVSKLEALPNGTFAEYYNEDGTIDTVTEDRVKADKELQDSINTAKQYLTDTDWIIVKLQEVQLLGSDISEMLTKYSAELTKREECRTLINELGGN